MGALELIESGEVEFAAYHLNIGHCVDENGKHCIIIEVRYTETEEVISVHHFDPEENADASKLVDVIGDAIEGGKTVLEPLGIFDNAPVNSLKKAEKDG